MENSSIRRVKLETLAPLLPLVQMPGRYTGGEFGAVTPMEGDAPSESVLVGIAFPDVYEIGMSNLAIKLLYRELNSMEGVRCERVFSPAGDFAELLEKQNIPLHSLESGLPLSSLDILGVSMGYELAATNIPAMLELGGIPVRKEERDNDDPIVVAGGPAITNPAPFSPFFDGVYIGEAEGVFPEIVSQIDEVKRNGGDRSKRLDVLNSLGSVWTEEKVREGRKATRAIWTGFDTKREGLFPVPNIDVVQDHGVVEIMRGCPNGCRFCHAGMLYRPNRQKSFFTIRAEVDEMVHRLGYREITLSSLSSGDFSGLGALVRKLNERYAGLGVSFALPSLRIDSFTLPILQEISRIRKSGLTFAVETPKTEWQNRVNKPVELDKVIDILAEARERGWNMAKFYFMVGLPPQVYTEGEYEHDSEGEIEADAIVEYLSCVRKESGFKLNVNIGTFIPKPHTPFQWAGQLSEGESLERIQRIKKAFKRSSVKLAYHSPFISLLEGLLSRGDRRVGELIIEAYRRGASFDAWEEHLSVDLWRELLEEASWDVVGEITRARRQDEDLPWNSVDLGINESYLKKEWEKSKEGELTEVCSFPCSHHCGVCTHGIRPETPEMLEDVAKEEDVAEEEEEGLRHAELPEGKWFLLEFRKTGKARFLSHINVMTIFERSFQRAGILLEYSKGYNPKPRLEFAHPLTLGISSEGEVCRAKIIPLKGAVSKEDLLDQLCGVFPEGFEVLRIGEIAEEFARGKGKSLMSLYAGARYRITPIENKLSSRADELSTSEAELNSHAAELTSRANESTSPMTELSSRAGQLPFLSVEREGSSLWVETAGSGKEAKALKELMSNYGGPGEFLSRYEVVRSRMYARMYAAGESSKTDYFTLFVK